MRVPFRPAFMRKGETLVLKVHYSSKVGEHEFAVLRAMRDADRAGRYHARLHTRVCDWRRVFPELVAHVPRFPGTVVSRDALLLRYVGSRFDHRNYGRFDHLNECLRTLHASGIVHADIKIQNVAFTERGARLLDAGTATTWPHALLHWPHDGTCPQWGEIPVGAVMKELREKMEELLPVGEMPTEEGIAQNFGGVLQRGEPVFPPGYAELRKREQERFRFLCRRAWNVLRRVDWGGLSLLQRDTRRVDTSVLRINEAYNGVRVLVRWVGGGGPAYYLGTVYSSVDGEWTIRYDDGDIRYSRKDKLNFYVMDGQKAPPLVPPAEFEERASSTPFHEARRPVF